MNSSLKTKAAGRLFLLAAPLGLFLSFQPLADAQIASDNASNYSGGWTSGSNGGHGFGEWVLSSDAGSGFAGHFIGSPSAAGITGMPNDAFALYANPSGSGARATAGRTFSTPLQVGETFSFDWGLNWDSDGAGGKGFSLLSEGIDGITLIDIYMLNNATIHIDGLTESMTMFNNYGNQAMTLSLVRTDTTSLRVSAIGRDGIESFDQTFSISAAPDAFLFYAIELQGGDERQPYFNNFQVIPEPSTYAAILGLGVLGLAALRRRMRG